ncbi:MAG: hypothetical protein H7061_00040 [Bdellovibrionaceae bacterium]|nr:hypothetical protein [Bdellovibrio sp.]
MKILTKQNFKLILQNVLKFNLPILIFFLTASCSSSVTTRESASTQVKLLAPVTGSQSVFPEPRLTNPKLRFHTGGVRENRPEISPDLPNISGAASPWILTQWRRPQFILPLNMQKDLAPDAVLGSATYYFPSEDKRSHLKIYKGKTAPYVYELFSQGGMLDQRGGTNVFLAADAVGNVTFEKMIDYEVDLKFSIAKIKYDTLLAKRTGAVMSQLFTGLTLHYEDAGNPTQTPINLFMQIYHNNTSYPDQSYRGCYRHGNIMEIVYGNILLNDPRLDFVSTNQPAKKMRFNVNQYLCDMITQGFSCDDNGKKYKFDFPLAAKNFENWKITSMYIGLETQDTDLRSGAFTNKPQGNVESAVQISNLSMTRNNDINFDYAKDCKKF